MTVLLGPEKRWLCPSCGAMQVTRRVEVHLPLHQCSAFKGAWVPYVEAGVKAHIRVNEREDYLNGEICTTDDEGRPIMSVTTLRDDGEDCTIFAPAARASLAYE